MNSSEVLAGENCTRTGTGDLVDDQFRHTGRRGADDGLRAGTQVPIDGLVRGVGGVVTGVAAQVVDRRAQHTARRVDVRDGEVNAGKLGGPRIARLPVSGSREPIVSGSVDGEPLGRAWGGSQSVAAAPLPPEAEPPSPEPPSPPEPHPATTTDRAPRRAAARSIVRCAIHVSFRTDFRQSACGHRHDGIVRP
ncbi:MAG: hypothetical protein WKF73_06995 [Nocardioidaceae bacterium]